MTEQEHILRSCDHAKRDCEVSMPDGERLSVCTICWNASVQARRDGRKAQLAAMDRCEVPGCSRRGTQIVWGHTLMCGHHLRRAEQGHYKAMASTPGGMGLFLPCPAYSKAELIELATSKA